MGAFYDKEMGQRQKSRRDTEAKNKQKALAQTFAKCMSWFLKTTGPPGQGGLVCCSPWGCKESDVTE